MRIFSYGIENSTVIRVPTPYYYLETMAFVRKDSDIIINNAEDLTSYNIVKVCGVKHTDNITKGLDNLHDLNNTKQIMIFLDKGKANIALTNTINGKAVIKELNLKNLTAFEHPLASLALFHYIHKRHELIVPMVDGVIKKMRDAGELKILIEKTELAILDY
jgi:polar amino acid transport system substrate-binding protein